MNRYFKLIFLFLIAAFLCSCTPFKALTIVSSGELATKSIASSTVPFRLTGHPMLIKAKLNRSPKEYTLVFDTGALTLIRESVAKKLDILPGLEVAAKGSAGKSTVVQLVTLNNLSVGNMVVTDCAAGVLSESSFSDIFPQNIDGVLGSNFLKLFKVTIDYKNKEITLSQAAESLEQQGAIAIPIKPDMKNGFAPKIACQIEGNIKSNAIIDTGSPITLLSLSTIKKTESFKNGGAIKAKGGMSFGIGGHSAEDYAVRISKLNIGSLQILNIPVLSNLMSESVELIGNDILSKYLVTINYPTKEMVLIPNGEPFDLNPLGYNIGLKKQKDSVLVSGIWPNTSAGNSGINIGEEIISINSIEANKLSYFEIMQIFMNKEKNHINIELVDKTGNYKKIKLQQSHLLPLIDAEPND